MTTATGSILQVGQALFYNDMIDYATGAVISDQFTERLFPPPMDTIQERFNILPVEEYDAASPFGAHGFAEPAVTNYSCIINAIYNATGKWVDPNHGAVTPDKVLIALGKA
jgi:CO/xanthine dehydrogenase Mo-binding subunit